MTHDAFQSTCKIYGTSLALLTDLYELTMAYGYWKKGMKDKEAVFTLFFRKAPFKSGFSIACGLHTAIEYMENFHFNNSDIEYLRRLKGNNRQRLFCDEFLYYLKKMRFTCEVDAIPEGVAVFPHEPLLRIQGPIIQCQLLESALLNSLNFQTLIATKAARVCLATKQEPVLEFGLRRAQGMDGALSASRAAYIAGCAGTSNVLAGKLFDIPVKGTHAHSWVMCFDNELESFKQYADAMPNNCVFLVDTYDTLAGVHNAVEVGRRLREQGFEMAGIRLDSGDLAYLSIEARKILDQAGFKKTAIVGSNELDENIIESLKHQGAAINVWGVGTKLITAYDQPALGGVYKLTAIRDQDAPWKYKLKLSEQAVKINNPGIQQVRRFYDEHEFIGDMIYDAHDNIRKSDAIIDPQDMTRIKKIPFGAKYTDLLVPIFREGKLVYKLPTLKESRQKVKNQLGMLHNGVKRFVNPHEYPVGLEKNFHQRKTKLIIKARETVQQQTQGRFER